MLTLPLKGSLLNGAVHYEALTFRFIRSAQWRVPLQNTANLFAVGLRDVAIRDWAK
jgi:hypothetical protein